MHPDTRCSTSSFCPWYTQQLQSSISPWVTFQNVVFTICSNIGMIDGVFRGWRSWVIQRSHSSSWFLKNLFFLFWLESFDYNLFGTLLNGCFHPFTLSAFLNDPLIIEWYCVVVESHSHAFFLPLLFLLWSQQHFLISMSPFSRLLGSTYSTTLTCSIPHAVFPHYKHLALILILFTHLIYSGKVSLCLSVFPVFPLIWVFFLWFCPTNFVQFCSTNEYVATKITLKLIVEIRFVSLGLVLISVLTLSSTSLLTRIQLEYNFCPYSISLVYP